MTDRLEAAHLMSLHSAWLQKSLRFCLLITLFSLYACSNNSPSNNVITQYREIEFTKDGAWCWFQDPRAVYISGQRKRTYAGWVTKEGQLQVGAFDHSTGQIEMVTIKEKWQIDDHDSNSFLVLPDKRIMVFYTRHNGIGLLSQTTVNPEDISKWTNEVVVANTRYITYSNPIYLTEEKRFYVFWRGETHKPTFSTSIDGVIWTAPQILLEDKGRESRTIRPYLKVISDGKSEIHFAFTDGHPRNEPENSIYYIKYKNGKFFRANGTNIGTMDDLPIQPHQSDIVYDGKVNKVRSWVWDIALNTNGNPVIAYTRLPKESDHRYHYAYWNGSIWLDSEITPGGSWFPQTAPNTIEREPHYSGGLAIDHEKPSIVYVSRKIDKAFEIEKWVTADQGKTWVSTAITSNSTFNNVRPVVPIGHETNVDSVLWMKGDYFHYTNFDTGVYILTTP